MKKIYSFLRGRRLIYTLSILSIILLTLALGEWPSIYSFATDPNQASISRLLSAPIHLADDVMISLRSGYIQNEIGMPAFNRSDIAQPSTSYLSPYVFSFLLKLFSANIAVPIYAGIGFLCVMLTFLVIIMNTKSSTNGILLVIALCLTTTNLGYALNGWDHLFQALFLTIAAVIVLNNQPNFILYMSGAFCLALGSLFRPDGILIAAGIIASAYMSGKKSIKTTVYLLAPFAAIVIGMLALNFIEFGHLTPTTVRLKLGASPSFEYVLKYFLTNGVFSFSAITILVALTFFYFKYRNIFLNRSSLPIALGCILTMIIAIINSDVFPGGRMFWSAACVMSLVMVTLSPKLFNLEPQTIAKQFSLTSDYQGSRTSTANFRLGVIVFVIYMLIMSGLIRKAFDESLVRESNLYTSATAQQFKVAKWIEKNLNPKDGAIGFYWLGVSYYLPNFEIADFVGKADELIATTSVRWGPPGHNKWDTDKTLEKWNLQAILPPGNSDYTNAGKRLAAKRELEVKKDFGFGPDLLLNKNIGERYAYCYLRPVTAIESPDRWGFLLRKDLVFEHQTTLLCNE